MVCIFLKLMVSTKYICCLSKIIVITPGPGAGAFLVSIALLDYAHRLLDWAQLCPYGLFRLFQLDTIELE